MQPNIILLLLQMHSYCVNYTVQIDKQRNRVKQLQTEIGKISQEIEKLEIKKSSQEEEKSSVNKEISEQSSIVEATSGIWENESDPVEKILFVEQVCK